MTKTLTEQWREGKLPENTYYVQFICGRYGVYEFEQYKGFGFDNDLAYIKEVLAPVPSYDHFSQLVKKVERLQEQLNEANRLILWCARISWTGNQEEDDFDRYLAKWGVK